MYAVFAGIIGGVASTIGLLAFISPRITGNDLRSIESELIQKLADAAKSVEDYESKTSENKEKLQELQRDQLQIELLVRQASVKIFLEEKINRLSAEIEKLVHNSPTLLDTLSDYEYTISQTRQLDLEIQNNPKADLIKDIIGGVSARHRPFYVDFGLIRVDATPIVIAAEILAKILAGGPRRWNRVTGPRLEEVAAALADDHH